MNHSNRSSSCITERQAVMVIEAAAHAYRLGKPFTHALTIHLQAMGVTQSHTFITAFFKRFGNSLRGKGGCPCWVWVLETGPGKGLHLHATLHVPPSQWQGFGKRARRWARQCLGSSSLPAKAMMIRKIRSGKFPGAGAYLGVWAKPGSKSYGLKGWLGYMLKGTAPVVAAKIGFQHHTQGMVANKRCGTSEAIGLAARQKYRPIMTTPHPRDPRIRLRTKAAVIERVLFYGGFTSDTGYQTPAD